MSTHTYIRISMYIQIHTLTSYIYIYIYISTYAFTCLCTHIQMCACECARTHSHISLYALTRNIQIKQIKALISSKISVTPHATTIQPRSPRHHNTLALHSLPRVVFLTLAVTTYLRSVEK